MRACGRKSYGVVWRAGTGNRRFSGRVSHAGGAEAEAVQCALSKPLSLRLAAFQIGEPHSERLSVRTNGGAEGGLEVCLASISIYFYIRLCDGIRFGSLCVALLRQRYAGQQHCGSVDAIGESTWRHFGASL